VSAIVLGYRAIYARAASGTCQRHCRTEMKSLIFLFKTHFIGKTITPRRVVWFHYLFIYIEKERFFIERIAQFDSYHSKSNITNLEIEFFNSNLKCPVRSFSLSKSDYFIKRDIYYS